MAPSKGTRGNKKKAAQAKQVNLNAPFVTNFRVVPDGTLYHFDPLQTFPEATVLRYGPVEGQPDPYLALAELDSATALVAEKVVLTLFHDKLGLFYVIHVNPVRERFIKQITTKDYIELPGNGFKVKASTLSFLGMLRADDEISYTGEVLTPVALKKVNESQCIPTDTPALEPTIPDTLVKITNTNDNVATQPEPAVRTDENFTPETQTKRKRNRYQKFSGVDFSSLTINIPLPENVVTILFRPTDQSTKLKDINPTKLAEELASFGQFTGLRDIRQGGLAVDFPPDTLTTPLLAVSKIADVPVSASLPASSLLCHGVATGIHWEIEDNDLIQNTANHLGLPVVAVKRLAKPGLRSWVVKYSFSGTVLPDKISLYGRSHVLTPYSRRPTLCGNCARWGHVASLCRSARRCFRCSGDHPATDCTATSPKCLNCGEAHSTDATICQTRSFESKITSLQASLKAPFKTVRAAVQKAAKSYASVVKQTPAASAMTEPRKNNFISNVPHLRPPTGPSPAALSGLFSALTVLIESVVPGQFLPSLLASVKALFEGLDAVAK